MRQTKTMDMSLTLEIHSFMMARISSGRFQNASEVVRGALHLLEEDERRRGAEDDRPNRR